MHLVVYCPSCRSRYQIDPGLRGKLMRCPNSTCREVFEVQSDETGVLNDIEEEIQLRPLTEGEAVNREEIVPVLDAEIVSQTPAAKPAADSTPVILRPEEEIPVVDAEEADDVSAAERSGSWQLPPPVRRRPEPGRLAGPEGEQTHLNTTERVEIPEAPPDDLSQIVEAPPSAVSRYALLAIGLMVGLGGLIIAAVTVYTLNVFVQREGNLFARSNRQYAEGKFGAAAQAYQELADEFSQSENAPTYRFLAELSELRDQASSDVELEQTAARIHQFLEKHQSDPLLHEHRQDVHSMLTGLAEQMIGLADQKTSLEILDKAREVLEKCEHYASSSEKGGESRLNKDRVTQVAAAITHRLRKQQLVSLLQELEQKSVSLDDVKQARERSRQVGLASDEEVRGLLARIELKAREQMRYVELQARPAPVAETSHEASILLTARLHDSKHALPPGNRVVLALARGVLYGLEQNTGEILWAERVGVDATALPVRLPRTSVSPELFLVLSSDQKALLALTAREGKLYWQYTLSADCLGRPLVVGPCAYVPTDDGKVHEIQTLSGNCLGYYELGQPLTVGGVHQPGTDLLYFPADSDYVYVLDTGATAGPNQSGRPKQCVAILHTGHPSGSLRSEPIIVNRFDPGLGPAGEGSLWPPYLILTQIAAGDQVKLRVFSLPIEKSDAPSLLNPEPSVRGQLWFRPYFDDEKIAFVTDRGVVGLFGIQQVRNDDSPLFREIRGDIELGNAGPNPVRAQVAYAVDNDFWIIANGRLQRYHLGIYNQQFKPVWPASLSLGSPLHAAQVDEASRTLTIVSHDLGRGIHLATCVDLEDGSIRWQRGLGLEISGDAVAIENGVVCADRAGSLFHFTDVKTPLHPGRTPWWKVDALRAKPVEEPESAVYLLPAADGRSVIQLVCPRKGTRLLLRKYTSKRGEGSKDALEEHVKELTSPLAGAPVPWGADFLLPLADGTIRRLTLGPEAGGSGPDWRSRRAPANATCYIVPLNEGEFLTTDGNRGLTHWQWRWRQGEGFHTIPIGPDQALELPARIVASPVLLAPAGAQKERRVAVADSEGNLRLLEGDDLHISRIWNLGGIVTAGPFVVGHRLGVVVDKSKLVLVDPAKETPSWSYTMAGDGIVDVPTKIDNLLVLADVSGRLVGLDLETGKPVGKGYLLKANAAPAAAPAMLNKNEALVPLTDGTLFVLPLKWLRG